MYSNSSPAPIAMERAARPRRPPRDPSRGPPPLPPAPSSAPSSMSLPRPPRDPSRSRRDPRDPPSGYPMSYGQSSSDVGTPGTLGRAPHAAPPVAVESAGRPRRPTRHPSDPPAIPAAPVPPSRSDRRARSRPPPVPPGPSEGMDFDAPRRPSRPGRDRSVPRHKPEKQIELNAKKTMDYRVSRVAILCRDCNQDVGFFPARHRCGHPNPTEDDDAPSAPPVPPLPTAAEGQTAGESSISTTMTNLWTKFQGLTVASRTSADSGTTGTTATPPNGAPGSRGSADSAPISPQDDNKEEQGMWAVWNKLKAQIGGTGGTQTSDDESDPEEVEKALRDYYAKKGGPVPEFLKEQSKATTKHDDLDRFEQRAATLGRSGGGARRPSLAERHDPYYDAPPRPGRSAYDDRQGYGRGYAPEDDRPRRGSGGGGGGGGRGGYLGPADDDAYYGRPSAHAATMSRADRGHPAYASPACGADPYYDQGGHDRRQYQQSPGYQRSGGDYHAGGYATVGRGYR